MLTNIQARIDYKWESRSPKMDWLGLEAILVDIQRADIGDNVKCALTREAIDAWTGRGHFVGERSL